MMLHMANGLTRPAGSGLRQAVFRLRKAVSIVPCKAVRHRYFEEAPYFRNALVIL
jgi:hypothetical protein